MPEITQSQQLDTVHNSKKWQVFAAALLGVVILSIVSLAPMEVIHNATHDVRHSSGFPCH